MPDGDPAENVPRDGKQVENVPKNRTPITTKVIQSSRLKKVYTFISEQTKLGKQCMIVYPLVEESEKSDIAAAVDMYKELKQNVFSDLNIEVIHGKMAPSEKKVIMEINSFLNSNKL